MDLIKSSRYLDDSFLEELCSYFSVKFIMFQEGRDMLGMSLFGTGPGDYYLMYGNNIRHHFSAIKNGVV